MAHESNKAIVAAIVGNFAVAVVKFITAGITGSSAMFSEGIHSVVDTGDGLLLYLGIKRSLRPPDSEHPFGYGKELYFWSLVVAMMIFAVGGGVTVYEGIRHVRKPEPIEDVGWTYGALAAAAVFEGAACFIAYRQFRKAAGQQPLWRAIRRSKDPTTFTVLIEDTAALIGIVIAFLGIGAAQLFNLPAMDGVASIVIGCLLGCVALLLGRECMSLLVGEGADPSTLKRIRAIAERQNGVIQVDAPLTMYFGPDAMMVTMEVSFRQSASIREIADSTGVMERQLREEFPKIKRVFISPKLAEGRFATSAR